MPQITTEVKLLLEGLYIMLPIIYFSLKFMPKLYNQIYGFWINIPDL